MFSRDEKVMIANKIEKLLLSLHHPEMPTERPKFKLHVDGAESWSWADITPNWVFADGLDTARVNPWNEKARDLLREKGERES